MEKSKRPLRVFLCYASDDEITVRQLYERLTEHGVDVWFDKENLIPGQNWQIEIPKAVRNSDIVIVCLSSRSVTKEGFVQKEIRFALDIADEKPDGIIFIIPARLENCVVPDRFEKLQWVDLFSDSGYERLIKAIRLRADGIGAKIKQKRDSNKPRRDINWRDSKYSEITSALAELKKWKTLYYLRVGEITVAIDYSPDGQGNTKVSFFALGSTTNKRLRHQLMEKGWDTSGVGIKKTWELNHAIGEIADELLDVSMRLSKNIVDVMLLEKPDYTKILK